MRTIGITGGVGAGKSMVLQYLKEKYGVQLILADQVGHEVMEPGKKAYHAVLEEFGKVILSENGEIDRNVLGAIVFSDKKKLEKLNGIIHPEVKKEILSRIDQAKREGVPCVAVEAALFLEENYDAFCSETWYIDTDKERRKNRLKENRGYSDERIDAIMANQKCHEEFLDRCQVVIDNNGLAKNTYLQIDKRMEIQ